MDRGPWIETYTGKQFYPFFPYPEDICIEDIAHALSNLCRFAGHVKEFYSVAQHSVYVSLLVPKEYAMLGLLHDATEAYLVDIPAPIKPYLDNYERHEDYLYREVAKKYGIPTSIPKEVDIVDKALCHIERKYLMPCGSEWGMKYPEMQKYIDNDRYEVNPLPPKAAKQLFLTRYVELGGV